MAQWAGVTRSHNQIKSGFIVFDGEQSPNAECCPAEGDGGLTDCCQIVAFCFALFLKTGARSVATRQAVGKRRGETVGNLGIGLPIVHRAQ